MPSDFPVANRYHRVRAADGSIEDRQLQVYTPVWPEKSDDENWQDEEAARLAFQLDQLAVDPRVPLTREQAEQAKQGRPDRTLWDRVMQFEDSSQERLGTWFQPVIDVATSGLMAHHAVSKGVLGFLKGGGSGFGDEDSFGVKIGGVGVGFSTKEFMDSWNQRQMYGSYGTGLAEDMPTWLGGGHDMNWAKRLLWDVALDPLTWMTFGIGSGITHTAKAGTRLGGNVLKQDMKLTLNRHGADIANVATRRLVPEIEKEVGLQAARNAGMGADKLVHLEHSAMLRLNERIVDYSIKNYDSLLTEHAASLSRVQKAMRVKDGIAHKIADVASQPAWRRTAEDMFQETASTLHKARGLTPGQGVAAGSILGATVAGSVSEAFGPVVGMDRDISGYVGTFLGGALGYKLVTKSYGTDFNRLLNRTHGMPDDIEKLYFRTKNNMQDEMGKEVERLEAGFIEAAGGRLPSRDELITASNILEQGEYATVKVDPMGTFLEALWKGKKVSDEVINLVNFAKNEFEDILVREQDSGFRVESLQNYLTHMYKDNNTVNFVKTKLNAHGGIPNSAQNGAGLGRSTFEFHRLIGTVEEAIQLPHIPEIETNLARILMRRKAASLRMLHRNAFYDIVRGSAGEPGVIMFDSFVNGKQTGLSLRKWLSKAPAKQSRMYLFDQHWSASDTLSDNLGFRRGEPKYVEPSDVAPKGQDLGAIHYPSHKQKSKGSGTRSKRELQNPEGARLASRENFALVEHLSKPLDERMASPLKGATSTANAYKQVKTTFKFKQKEAKGKEIDALQFLNRIVNGDGDVYSAIKDVLPSTKGSLFPDMAKVKSFLRQLDDWSRKEFETPIAQLVPDLVAKLEGSLQANSKFGWSSGKKLRVKTVRSVEDLETRFLRRPISSNRVSAVLPEQVINRARWWRMRTGDFTDFFPAKSGSYKELSSIAKSLGLNHDHIKVISKNLVGKEDISKLSARDMDRLQDYLAAHVSEKYRTKALGRKPGENARSNLFGENLEEVIFNTRRAPDFGDIDDLLKGRAEETGNLIKNSDKRVKIDQWEIIRNSAKNRRKVLEDRLTSVANDERGLSPSQAKVRLDVIKDLKTNISKLDDEIHVMDSKIKDLSDMPDAPVRSGGKYQGYIGRKEMMASNKEVFSEMEIKNYSKRHAFKAVETTINKLKKRKNISAQRKHIQRRIKELEKEVAIKTKAFAEALESKKLYDEPTPETAVPPVKPTPETAAGEQLYAWTDGESEAYNLTRSQMAEKVRENPSGSNSVSRLSPSGSFDDWKPAKEILEQTKDEAGVPVKPTPETAVSDDLYNLAVTHAVRTDDASIGSIQKELNVDEDVAKQILNQMEKEGLVSKEGKLLVGQEPQAPVEGAPRSSGEVTRGPIGAPKAAPPELDAMAKAEKNLAEYKNSLTEKSPIELVGFGKYRVKETGKVHDIVSYDRAGSIQFAGKYSEDIERALVTRSILNPSSKRFNSFQPIRADDVPQRMLGTDSQRMFVPSSIANLIREINAPIYSSIYPMLNKLAAGQDIVNSIFKVPMLAMWGSTMMRNTIGNVSQTYMRLGVGFLSTERFNDFMKLYFYALGKERGSVKAGIEFTGSSLDKLGKHQVKALGDVHRGGARTVAEMYEEMGQHGVLSGMFHGEIEGELAQIAATKGPVVKGVQLPPPESFLGAMQGGMIGAMAGPLGAAAGMAIGAVAKNVVSKQKWAFKIGEHATELPTRMFLGLNVYKDTGSLMKMSDDVRFYLHDYSELSMFEKRVIKRAMPFYNFVKMATRVIGKEAFEHPGRTFLPWKIFNAQNQTGRMNPFGTPIEDPLAPEDYPDFFHHHLKFMGREVDEEGNVKSWLRTGFNLPIQEVGTLLDEVMPGGREGAATLSRGPFLSTSLFESAFNYDTFRRSKIRPDEPGERTTFARGAPFKGSPDWLKTLVQYREDENGVATVNPDVAWALGEIPSARFLNITRQIYEMDEEGQKSLNYNALSKAVLAWSVYRFDPESQTYWINKAKIDKMEMLLSSVGRLKSYRQTYIVDPDKGSSESKSDINEHHYKPEPFKVKR